MSLDFSQPFNPGPWTEPAGLIPPPGWLDPSAPYEPPPGTGSTIDVGPIHIPIPAPGENPNPTPGRGGGLVTPPGPPYTPGAGTGSPGPSTGTPPATQAFDFKAFLVWLGALGLLWLILGALVDTGNAKFAYSLAALILGGALIFMGPQAIKNAQQLFA